MNKNTIYRFLFILVFFSGITFFLSGMMREVQAWDDPGTCNVSYKYCNATTFSYFCTSSTCNYSCADPAPSCPSECTYDSQCEPPPVQYRLTTLVSPTGSATILPSTQYYDEGRDVTVITRYPAAGYVFSYWSGACSGGGTCTVRMDNDKTVTAHFVIPLTPTLTAGLTVSPTSGTTNTTFNFTTTVGGTATGTITYGTPSCGTGGSRSNWSGSADNTFSCTYTSTGTKTATTYVARQGLNASGTRSLTVGALSLTAGLTVSPTSGDTNTTFNFTTTVGGTATGTVAYGTPNCGTGGTLSSWSGSADNTFSCVYSSSGTKTITAPVSRQGLNATGTRSLTVATAPTLTASLGVSPTSGDTNTTYNFTTTVTGGTATGTVTYGTPNCGTGGTLSNWSGSADNTFSCQYSSSGTKTAMAPVARQGVSTTPTRSLSVGTLTLTGSLAVSPTSGTTNTTYNFTTTVTGGTATGTVTYGTPNCGSGGTRTSWNGTNLFSCTYTSSGLKAASAPITRQGVAATPTVSFTIGSVTVNASLAVSPTSGGTTATTYDFTTSVTGGTATGTITYGTPSCGSGVSYTNWSGSTTGSTFSCRYPTSGPKTATASVTRQGVGATPSIAFSVNDVPPPPPPPPPVLSVRLDGPTLGTINQVLNFEPVRRDPPSSTTTGELTFSNARCEPGGVLNWTGNPSDRYFSCIYGSTGAKNVSIQVSQGGITETASGVVTISEPVITSVDVSVAPNWVSRGGSTILSWDIQPPEAESSAVCTVASAPIGVAFSSASQTSVNASDIQQVTELTVTCSNAVTSGVTGSALVYILPSFSEF